MPPTEKTTRTTEDAIVGEAESKALTAARQWLIAHEANVNLLHLGMDSPTETKQAVHEAVARFRSALAVVDSLPSSPAPAPRGTPAYPDAKVDGEFLGTTKARPEQQAYDVYLYGDAVVFAWSYSGGFYSEPYPVRIIQDIAKSGGHYSGAHADAAALLAAHNANAGGEGK